MSKRYTDQQGRTLGYLDDSRGSDGRQRVEDPSHRTIGWIDNHGTYDANGHPIASSPIPGLLINDQDCKT